MRAADAEPNVLEAEFRYSGSKTGLTSIATVRPAASVETNLLNVLTKDPNSLSVFNALLFEGTEEELLKARRELRIAWLAPPPIPPQVDSPVLNPIDQFIASKWRKSGLPSALKPPEVCDDSTFLRRVYLDLIGVIPTVEEAKGFLGDSSEGKRAKLVEELLNRNEAYAAHWSSMWLDLLANESVSGAGGIPRSGDYRDWIFQGLVENRPYDLLISQFLDPSMPAHRNAGDLFGSNRRAVSELESSRRDADAIHAAANAAQVFLGVNVNCAICHDDPENSEWSNERFLAFAGFFTDRDLKSSIAGKSGGSTIPAAFPFEIPGAPTAAPPGREVRLRRLAQLVVDPANPRFAKTIINRLWKQFFGLGLIEPCNDARADHSVFHSELLEWMADDLIRHGFDLKHAIRRIVSSRTYQLPYDSKLADRFDSEHSEAPRFYQSPALRRLSAEQILDSIRIVTDQQLGASGRAYSDTRTTPLRRALGYPSWREPLSPIRPDAKGTVGAMVFLYGTDYWQMISETPMIQRLAKEKNSGRAVEEFYWTVLTRPPTNEERRVGIEFLEATFSGEFKTASSEMATWLDDDLPQGGIVSGSAGAESWNWVSTPEFPVLSGRRSHTQVGAGIQRQHYFSEANPSLAVNSDDVLFAHVFLEPSDLPREIMMQWNDGSWEHRAYWGENLIRLGQDASPGRMRMGPLPKAGEWVMLKVPVRDVGIKGGSSIAGWSFDQLDGTVYWDKAGVIRVRNVPPEEPLLDVLWALLSSPEFQFIR